MACMTHYCIDCGYETMNNKPKDPRDCPRCGHIMSHMFDEWYDIREDSSNEEEYER